MSKKSKIELQGLTERIIDMYDKDQMTMKDIAMVLADEGYEVSCTGVYREVSRWKKLLESQKVQDKYASQFLQEFKNRPNTDISELNLQIMQRKIFAALQELEDDKVDFKDTTAMVNAMARLADSQVNLDRLKTEFQKGVQAAKDLLMGEFQHLLAKDHPEMLLKILDIIKQVDIDSDGRKRKKKKRRG